MNDVPLFHPTTSATLQEESLAKELMALEGSQAKLEAAQKQLESERRWLTEQQQTLSKDQAVLAAWRSDQVGCAQDWGSCCFRLVSFTVPGWVPMTLTGCVCADHTCTAPGPASAGCCTGGAWLT
jgi:hypothetical protein